MRCLHRDCLARVTAARSELLPQLLDPGGEIPVGGVLDGSRGCLSKEREGAGDRFAILASARGPELGQRGVGPALVGAPRSGRAGCAPPRFAPPSCTAPRHDRRRGGLHDSSSAENWVRISLHLGRTTSERRVARRCVQGRHREVGPQLKRTLPSTPSSSPAALVVRCSGVSSGRKHPQKRISAPSPRGRHDEPRALHRRQQLVQRLLRRRFGAPALPELTRGEGDEIARVHVGVSRASGAMSPRAYRTAEPNRGVSVMNLSWSTRIPAARAEPRARRSPARTPSRASRAHRTADVMPQLRARQAVSQARAS